MDYLQNISFFRKKKQKTKKTHKFKNKKNLKCLNERFLQIDNDVAILDSNPTVEYFLNYILESYIPK